MNSELSDAIRRIIGILRQTGHSERAAWIFERFEVLRGEDSTQEARDTATTELHGIVKGEDGLLSLTMVPLAGYGITGPVAREQLDELANRLYDLTLNDD